MRVTAGRLLQVERLPLMMMMMRENSHNLMRLSSSFEGKAVLFSDQPFVCFTSKLPNHIVCVISQVFIVTLSHCNYENQFVCSTFQSLIGKIRPPLCDCADHQNGGTFAGKINWQRKSLWAKPFMPVSGNVQICSTV